MGNWAELHEDLIFLLAKRICLLEDFLAFGGVCRSWRSVKNDFKGSSPSQIPWLMLAEEEEEKNKDERRFASLTRGGMTRRLTLPEAKGKRCMESLGWLVTISVDGEINLLNPSSRVQIALPHLTTFKYADSDATFRTNFFYLYKAVLSSSPSCSDDYVLMVISGAIGRLSFWRPGDKLWTTIETHEGFFYDITYYEGQFYAVNSVGRIYICGVGGPDPTLAQHVGGIPDEIVECKRSYIVELAGRLVIVVRDRHDDLTYLPGYVSNDDDDDRDHDDVWIVKDESTIDYGATEFLVFDVDMINGRWAEMKSLGDYALFLGNNASISVNVSEFPEIKANCVYYTDDCWEAYIHYRRGGGKDMGIFNLDDRTLTPHYQGKSSLSRISPPLWITPFF